VLILSQFAGAAEEMTEALIVNPYSIEETAEVIRSALEMNLTERRTRHGALLAGVEKHDAAAWSKSFLERLKHVRSTDDPSGSHSPEPIRTALDELQQSMRSGMRPQTPGEPTRR
jgi:trehalose 6-phosphate synthase